MSQSSQSDQIALFPGLAKEYSPKIRPWRKTLADGGREESLPEKAESCFLDLLRQVVKQELSSEECCLLSLLLEKDGGPVPTGSLTRRFGSEDDDGWFWNETPPTSVMGRLRLYGLAFIGRTAVDGRLVRSMVIPKELRPLLLRMLA